MDFPEIPLWLKFLIATIWDIVDLTIGRVPLFGSFFDFAGGILAILLWGYEGLLVFWELMDVTYQVDSFFPTPVIIGIIYWLRKRGYETEEIAGKAKMIKGGIKR